MTRPKTKRIVWTLAVLLVLSFVAAVFLLRSPKPKVIGNLSKEDVAEISKAALGIWREVLKEEMKILWKEKEIRFFMRKLYHYNFDRVLTIQVVDSRRVRIAIGTKPSEDAPRMDVMKIDGHWVP